MKHIFVAGLTAGFICLCLQALQYSQEASYSQDDQAALVALIDGADSHKYERDVASAEMPPRLAREYINLMEGK